VNKSLFQTINDQFSIIHRTMRDVEDNLGKRHYHIIEINFDDLDKQLADLKELVEEKKQSENLHVRNMLENIGAFASETQPTGDKPHGT
jgi:hypothetical protein